MPAPSVPPTPKAMPATPDRKPKPATTNAPARKKNPKNDIMILGEGEITAYLAALAIERS